VRFVLDDGGRACAGFKGETDDCVCRSIAIAMDRPYREVYDELWEASRAEKPSKNKRGKSSPRTGVHKDVIRTYLESHGWEWTPTMQIGSGCTVHLREKELPPGRLIVSVSRHTTAVIDGVIHDTRDPSRNGQRCVYGYFRKREE
jgi:hypothetical protein